MPGDDAVKIDEIADLEAIAERVQFASAYVAEGSYGRAFGGRSNGFQGERRRARELNPCCLGISARLVALIGDDHLSETLTCVALPHDVQAIPLKSWCDEGPEVSGIQAGISKQVQVFGLPVPKVVGGQGRTALQTQAHRAILALDLRD